MSKKEIILGVTASIAAYRACDITRAFKEENFNVTVIMTQDAKEFITPLTLSTLSRNKVYPHTQKKPALKNGELGVGVYSAMFGDPEAWDVEHVSLSDKADLILIAPATADIIAKLACGTSDDLLTCTVLATKAPILIAPAMNTNMYEHKVTQGNIAKLKNLGYKFVGPTKGKLATGKVGIGHLASVEEIVGEAKRILGK